MKRIGLESLLVIIVIASVFLWQKSNLSAYTVPLLAGITLLYLVTTFLRKRKLKIVPSFLLIASSLLLILATGGIHSALFFLLYFLSFTIAFILAPETVFAFNVGLFIAFLPEGLQGDMAGNITKLASLLLLCPIAYFFGKEIQNREKRERKTQEAVIKIQNDVSDVIKAEGENLKEQNVEKLADIVSQTKKLEKPST